MQLSDWLTHNNISVAVFAERIGVTAQAVRLWTRGERMPGVEQISAIQRVTEGQVTANDLHVACLARLARAGDGGAGAGHGPGACGPHGDGDTVTEGAGCLNGNGAEVLP